MAVAGVIVVCVLILVCVLVAVFVVMAFLAPGAQQRQCHQQQHQELLDVHGGKQEQEMWLNVRGWWFCLWG